MIIKVITDTEATPYTRIFNTTSIVFTEYAPESYLYRISFGNGKTLDIELDCVGIEIEWKSGDNRYNTDWNMITIAEDHDCADLAAAFDDMIWNKNPPDSIGL